MVHYIHVYQRVIGFNFQIKIVFLSQKIILYMANSADLDEMLHYALFHLGFHFLQVCISESLVYKGLTLYSIITPCDAFEILCI